VKTLAKNWNLTCNDSDDAKMRSLTRICGPAAPATLTVSSDWIKVTLKSCCLSREASYFLAASRNANVCVAFNTAFWTQELSGTTNLTIYTLTNPTACQNFYS
jgi:hypothetical protein